MVGHLILPESETHALLLSKYKNEQIVISIASDNGIGNVALHRV
jgi:hypothetical protein